MSEIEVETTVEAQDVVNVQDDTHQSDSPLKRGGDDIPEGALKKRRLGLDDIGKAKEDPAKHWSLQDDLLNYFQKYTKIHLSDKDIQEDVCDVYPIPDNLPKALVLDSHMETHLRKKQKGAIVERDNDLSRLTEKLLAIMGPLGRAWNQLDLYSNDLIADDEIHVDKTADQLEKAVVLLGQVINNVTYQRRLSVLSNVGDLKEAMALLRDDKIQKQLLEGDQEVLLGDPFKKSAKTELDTTKGLIDFLNRNKKEPAEKSSGGKSQGAKRFPSKKQPFSEGPSFPRGERKGQYNDGYRNRFHNFPKKPYDNGGQGGSGGYRNGYLR